MMRNTAIEVANAYHKRKYNIKQLEKYKKKYDKRILKAARRGKYNIYIYLYITKFNHILLANLKHYYNIRGYYFNGESNSIYISWKK